MFTISHIVVATDLTPRSAVALQRAARLKQELPADVTVMHVLDGASGHSIRHRALDRLHTEVDASFGAGARHLWLKVLEGQDHAAIIAEAAAIGADLILLGDARKPGWRERFIGTTTECVVRLSRLPVLVARRPGRPYERVLSAFDGSPAACRALGMGRTIAGGSQCRVVHANERPIVVDLATRRAGDAVIEQHVSAITTAVRITLQQLALTVPDVDVRVIDGNAHFLMRDQLREFDPDLVTVGTHARGAVASKILGSFARDLVADTDCDVLIAPPAGA
jgi:nucleotide-binding universal stress UspA family protein